jgi:hypothetical protein
VQGLQKVDFIVYIDTDGVCDVEEFQRLAYLCQFVVITCNT